MIESKHHHIRLPVLLVIATNTSFLASRWYNIFIVDACLFSIERPERNKGETLCQKRIQNFK